MSYFKDYMISVCAILTITSVASEILVDFSWSKYIHLICGILFAVCLITPLLNAFDTGFSFSYPNFGPDKEKDYVFEEVKKDFSDRLCDTIRQDVKEKFHTDIQIDAELTYDNKIYIYYNKPVKEPIYDYIKETYKPNKIRILGE